MKHLSAYDQVLDASRNKKHFPGNIENINFYQIDGFFTLGVENCGSFENFKTEIKEFEKILDEQFIGEGPGEKSVVPLTSAEDDVVTDFPLGNISPKSEEDIQLISQTFNPKEVQEANLTFTANSSNVYDMQKFPRGKLIIINVKNFKKSSRFQAEPREGTDRDASRLRELSGFRIFC